MSAVIIENARVVTMAGAGVVSPGRIVIEDGLVRSIDGGGAGSGERAGAELGGGAARVDAAGRVVMPAFVDCHTHACWAGDRLDEWQQKLAGVGYLELLERGGGIMSTVRAVRGASRAELADALLARLDLMLRHGTAVAEVKSGYGLDTASELKMLEAIVDAGGSWAGTVVPTACIGHAVDPEVGLEEQVRRTVEETLPAVHAAFPGVTIDAYCERAAWPLGAALRLFDAALELGHPVRVHADQFTDLGLIPEAVRRGFVSVDHLEASTPAHVRSLAASSCFGVMLPCSGFHTDDRYANGRGFVDAGGGDRLAIATNLNPGSAPSASMAMAMALAVRKCGLTPAEALRAATATPAAVLRACGGGVSDGAGTIGPGRSADLVMLGTTDERELCHAFGHNLVQAVWVRGRRVI